MKPNHPIIWTRNYEDGWKRWDSPVFFLDAISDAITRMKSIFIMDDGVDERQLSAVIRTMRCLVHGPIEIVVGSVHPSLSRLESVRQAGADGMQSISDCRGSGQTELTPTDEAVKLGDRLCPLLHLKHERSISLSVCGRHNDAMVLAHHHLKKWCLENKEECPHWNEHA